MPSLYVGTYHKYNSGSIFGKWLDLEDYTDPEEFYAACKKLHKDEEDPEFMFQDYEDFPSSLYSESGGVNAIYAYIDLDDHDREIIDAYDEQLDADGYQDVIDRFYGFYDSLEDFAYEYVENCMEIPESMANYFDYEKFGRDLGHDFNICETETGIAVFTC